MKTTAAVVYETGKPVELVELDLDGPRAGEARQPRRRPASWPPP